MTPERGARSGERHGGIGAGDSRRQEPSPIALAEPEQNSAPLLRMPHE